MLHGSEARRERARAALHGGTSPPRAGSGTRSPGSQCSSREHAHAVHGVEAHHAARQPSLPGSTARSAVTEESLVCMPGSLAGSTCRAGEVARVAWSASPRRRAHQAPPCQLALLMRATVTLLVETCRIRAPAASRPGDVHCFTGTLPLCPRQVQARAVAEPARMSHLPQSGRTHAFLEPKCRLFWSSSAHLHQYQPRSHPCAAHLLLGSLEQPVACRRCVQTCASLPCKHFS